MLSIRSEGSLEYSKIFPTLSRIYSEEGLPALFRGVVPRTLWIALGGAVFLGTFESIKRLQQGNVVDELDSERA